MADYTIKHDRVALMARQCIDATAYNAIQRFAGELGGNADLARRIAVEVASSAMEMLISHCNAELRLIALADERAYQKLVMAKPASFFIDKNVVKGGD